MARQVRKREDDTGRSVEPAVIPVIQEQATIKKRVVETGRVHVAKRVREYEELVDIPHFQEEVRVERVPVNRFVDDVPTVRTEGETTIIPVLEERYTVEKRLFLTEELHVSKERKEQHHHQKVKVLKEEVEIKRMAPGDAAETAQPRAKAAKPRH